MASNEKGHPEGAPIPDCVVYHDATEFKASPLNLQVSQLVRLYAVNASIAEAIAPLVFLEAMR